MKQTPLSYLSIRRVSDVTFHHYQITPSKSHSIGLSKDYFLKVEHIRNPKKLLTLNEEAEIISNLNKQHAISVPRLIEVGKTDAGEDYYITERLQSEGRPSTADMLLSLLEQKSLGVYQGDFKPENMIFTDNICYLVDYDQAQPVAKKRAMKSPKFIDWIAEDFEKRRGHAFFKDSARDFDRSDFMSHFTSDGKFLIENTSLMKTQNTTDTATGIYHSIDTPHVYAKGARDTEAREKILSKLPIKKDEEVLDIGCNYGLLTNHFALRGAKAHGVDMDKAAVKLAQGMANIERTGATFSVLDLDESLLETEYDTVCLFSVLQHIVGIKTAAKNIASKTKKRLIIEARLNEGGVRPSENEWLPATKWKFDTFEQLAHYFEKLFPGFSFEKDWGEGDRERHILTFKRTGK